MDRYIDKNNPCYKCSNRKLYCHSRCEEYLVWKGENDKRRRLTTENDRYVYQKAVERHKRER